MFRVVWGRRGWRWSGGGRCIPFLVVREDGERILLIRRGGANGVLCFCVGRCLEALYGVIGFVVFSSGWFVQLVCCFSQTVVFNDPVIFLGRHIMLKY